MGVKVVEEETEVVEEGTEEVEETEVVEEETEEADVVAMVEVAEEDVEEDAEEDAEASDSIIFPNLFYWLFKSPSFTLFLSIDGRLYR